MGSPIVFQTAPPQPASKARMTCSPQLAGGPEASQKGLGQRMPAKLVVRSAMLRLRKLARHRQGSTLPVGHGVHHFPSAVPAIAAGIILRVAGPPGGPVYRDRAAVQFDSARLVQHRSEEHTSELQSLRHL